MNLTLARVLLTGAAGGIGSATARELGRAGAALLLTDLRTEPLAKLVAELRAEGIDAGFVTADLGAAADRDELVRRAAELRANTLVNIAGVNPFGLFSAQDPADLELVFRINTIFPIVLCRQMLPVLQSNASAHIVNVGSAFGAIGFPGFTAYSASKFAIRGFSEALRRELADSRVHVHYVAPRATRTRLVTDRVRAMNEALGVAMDPPATVARAIVKSLGDDRRELAIGLPERVYAKINALLPALVDRALRKRLATIRRYASSSSTSVDHDQPATELLKPLQEKPQ